MPSPIPEATRAAILEDLESDTEESCRTIAKRHGVSDATVRKIAKDEGFTNAFTRADTKRATEAQQADNARTRAELGRRFLKEAHAALDALHEPHIAFSFGGRENDYNEHEFPEPPPADKRNLMTIAAIAADKHLAIDKHDNAGEGLAAVDAWLRGITGQ